MRGVVMLMEFLRGPLLWIAGTAVLTWGLGDYIGPVFDEMGRNDGAFDAYLKLSAGASVGLVAYLVNREWQRSNGY